MGEFKLSIAVIAILRAVHIAFGAFWLGGVASLGFFLVPWLRTVRPFGAGSAAQVATVRRLLTVVAVSGVIAVAAGHILYFGLWQGAGFSGPGFWYAAGGQPANIAVLLTSAIAWPAAYRLSAFVRSRTSPESPLTDEQAGKVDRLVRRVAWSTQVSAALLVGAVVCMAIGRYV